MSPSLQRLVAIRCGYSGSVVFKLLKKKQDWMQKFQFKFKCNFEFAHLEDCEEFGIKRFPGLFLCYRLIHIEYQTLV